MAREIKDRWLGARVGLKLEAEVNEYIEVADMTMGELVRASVEEYMLTHPKGALAISKIQSDKPSKTINKE